VCGVSELQCQCCSMFGQVVSEYLQKQSINLAMLGRSKQSSHNLATIWPTIQLIIAIKQDLRPCLVGIISCIILRL
jgi:hypothetical protein